MKILVLGLVTTALLVCVLHSRSTRVLHLSQRPHIVIILVASNESLTEDIKISVDEKAAYAKRHNYDFKLTPWLNESIHPSWSKIIQVSNLSPIYPTSWFWLLDADTVITNPYVEVHKLLPQDARPQVVIGQDCNVFNCGSFFIRSSEWSKWYADHLLSLPEDDIQPLHWWEQSAIFNTYRYKNVSKYIWIAPIYWFNAYPEESPCKGGSGAMWRPWEHGDLLVHAAGLSPEKKIELLREYRLRIPTDFTNSSISRKEVTDWWK